MAQERTIQDYYEEIYDKYPNIPKSDIKRILQYGWKALHIYNCNGGDVLLNRQKFWMYCGSLMNKSLRYFNYYKSKMKVKLRVMYKRKHIPWNGYYYFALTEKQYQEYLSQKNKKGRPRKKFTFNKVFLYKIYDECIITESGNVALFRIPLKFEKGFTLYKEELITDKAELILERQPLTFNDILLSNYNYEFISDDLTKHKKKTHEK